MRRIGGVLVIALFTAPFDRKDSSRPTPPVLIHESRHGDILPEMNKKALRERDICTKFITPALVEARWDMLT